MGVNFVTQINKNNCITNPYNVLLIYKRFLTVFNKCGGSENTYTWRLSLKGLQNCIFEFVNFSTDSQNISHGSVC